MNMYICKYLSPLKLHKNDFVLRTYRWISNFRRKKGLKICFSVAEMINKESNKEIILFLWEGVDMKLALRYILSAAAYIQLRGATFHSATNFYLAR